MLRDHVQCENKTEKVNNKKAVSIAKIAMSSVDNRCRNSVICCVHINAIVRLFFQHNAGKPRNKFLGFVCIGRTTAVKCYLYSTQFPVNTNFFPINE